MADQTAVKSGNGKGQSVAHSLADFGNDIASLAELQAKLAALDFKESAERAAVPVGVLGTALAVLLGCVPVLLLGVATLLATWLQINAGWAMVGVALVVMAGAGGAALVAARQLPESFAGFRRTREELTRNLSWIRTVLVYSGRSVPRRGS